MADLKDIINMIEESMAECFQEKGVKGVNTQEMSLVADILKDLIHCVYEMTIIEAMEHSTPEEIKQMAM